MAPSLQRTAGKFLTVGGLLLGAASVYRAAPGATYRGIVAPQYVPAGVQNYDQFQLLGNWSGTNDAGARGTYFVYLQDYESGELVIYCRGYSFGLWGFTDLTTKGPFHVSVNGVDVPGMTQRQTNPNGTYYSWRYYTHPRQARLTDFVIRLKFTATPGIFPAFDGVEAIS